VVPGPGLTAPGVTAVVVSYNSRNHLGPCLDSLAAAGVGVVVVVDNASSDDSRQVVASRAAGTALWVDAGGNLGYGRAANLGAAHPAAAGSPYLLVCNPDLRVAPGAVRALVAALESDPGAALAGPRLVQPDGALYPSARTFPDLLDALGHGLLGLFAPSNRFTRRYRMLDWDHGTRAAVDWVSGACFLARREAWDRVGGFDPSYFMYLEDVDLCWRLARAGWRVLYEPEAEALHVQGASADLHPYRMLAAHHRSLWRFARRTTSGPRRLALPLVGAGLVGRLAVASARRCLAGRRPTA
jgi:N-acetylglucosaminyl-diphospho-decaprenol L-rhamnosyltransferase